MKLAAERAREFARVCRKQRLDDFKHLDAQATALRDELNDILAMTRAMAQEPLRLREPRLRLRRGYDSFFEGHGKVYGAQLQVEPLEPTRRTLRRAVPTFQRLARSLDRLEELDRLHDIAMHQARGVIVGVVIVLFLLGYGPLTIIRGLLAAMGLCWHAWRWFGALGDLDAALKLVPLRVFGEESARA